MNLYQMNVDEIERHIRNNPQDVDTLTRVIFEKYKEVTATHEELCNVLDDLDLSTDPAMLEDELRTVYYDWDCDKEELKTVKKEFEEFKNEQSL